jgi:hypothetical protein
LAPCLLTLAPIQAALAGAEFIPLALDTRERISAWCIARGGDEDPAAATLARVVKFLRLHPVHLEALAADLSERFDLDGAPAERVSAWDRNTALMLFSRALRKSATPGVPRAASESRATKTAARETLKTAREAGPMTRSLSGNPSRHPSLSAAKRLLPPRLAGDAEACAFAAARRRYRPQSIEVTLAYCALAYCASGQGRLQKQRK